MNRKWTLTYAILDPGKLSGPIFFPVFHVGDQGSVNVKVNNVNFQCSLEERVDSICYQNRAVLETWAGTINT